MSFKRRICRFDGPDDNTYVEVWQTVGTFEIVRSRAYPPPTRGNKIDVFTEYSQVRALTAAASIARDLFDGLKLDMPEGWNKPDGCEGY